MGHDFDYVTNILYDQYGQRTRIDYGNGTFTEYNYDSVRRWLDTIKTENKWGQSYQNISYSFDAVGNVLGYENNCLDNVIGNYKTRQTYSYDNLYQLIKVEGETTYDPYHSELPEFVSNYSQNFEFDTDGLGNMTSKVSKESVSPLKKIGDNLNYNFTYVYDENFAHRLVRAGDRYYKYDSNGKIVWHADYEAFGNIMNERGEENFTPNYTGKFFDKTTGLYYFNARWYDSALGRFTTQDPARDGVNWWAYCGGNPITFVDPTGREAGYYTDDDGAGGFGHSGMYVTGEDGKYYVFEVIGVGEKSNNKIAINNKKGTTLQDSSGLNTTIISNITDNSFPPPELSEKMNKSGQAACLMRKFDSFEDMEVGLMKLGFDNCITFDTTPDQDSVILNAALSDGSDFSNYHLLSNSCGGWARDVLCTNGSGIKPFNPYANIKYLGSSAIPKAIGANLLLGNSNASYRDFGKK